MLKGAEISECGTYRWLLWREWDAKKPYMVFIMLNPSTADAVEDDPTIRRCIGFAKREGCGGIEVANLFSLRSTDPAALREHDNPVGPETDSWIEKAARHPDTAYVVAAWGAHGKLGARDADARMLLHSVGKPLYHLGLTKAGQPKHPLYLKSDTPLEEWTYEF